MNTLQIQILWKLKKASRGNQWTPDISIIITSFMYVLIHVTPLFQFSSCAKMCHFKHAFIVLCNEFSNHNKLFGSNCKIGHLMLESCSFHSCSANLCSAFIAIQFKC